MGIKRKERARNSFFPFFSPICIYLWPSVFICGSVFCPFSRGRDRQQFFVLAVVFRIVVAGRDQGQVVVHLVPREDLAELGNEQTGLHVAAELLKGADVVGWRG